MTIKNYWTNICSECGAENTFEIYRLIDPTSDSHLKQRILEEKIFYFTCPNCLFEDVNTYDIVYHNPVSKSVVAFLPSRPDIEPWDDEVLYLLQRNATDTETYYLRHPYISEDWEDFKHTIKKYSGLDPLPAYERKNYEDLAQKDPIAFFTIACRDQKFRKHSYYSYFSESIITKYGIGDLVMKRKKEEINESFARVKHINEIGDILRSLTAEVSCRAMISEDGSDNTDIAAFRIPDSDNPWGGEVYDLERNKYRKVEPLPSKSKLESFNRLRFLDEGIYSPGLKPEFNTESISLLTYPGVTIPDKKCFFRSSEIEDKFDVFGSKEVITFYDCQTGSMLCQLSINERDGTPEIYYYIYNSEYFGRYSNLMDKRIDFMFRTYVMNETVPCPVPKHFRDKYDAMCDYAFSLFGRKGVYGKIFFNADYITNISADAFLNSILPNFPSVNTQVIDVRTPGEFSLGHIEGSYNLDIRNPNFEKEITKLDKRKVWYVISNENERATVAKEIMDKMGFDYVHDIKGGYKEWEGKLERSE